MHHLRHQAGIQVRSCCGFFVNSLILSARNLGILNEPIVLELEAVDNSNFWISDEDMERLHSLDKAGDRNGEGVPVVDQILQLLE